MENSNSEIPSNTKLKISFPKSTEDHRLQLVSLNDAIFAILHSPLDSQGPIQLNCDEWSLVILSPITSKTDISISAINVISLHEIASSEGQVRIHASNQLISFQHMIKPFDKANIRGEVGEFEFDEDPGALLQYHRLFNSLSAVRSSEDVSEPQKNFMTSLCLLADRIKGKPGNLNLAQVLKFWDIPLLES